jgi:hypothetical protein
MRRALAALAVILAASLSARSAAAASGVVHGLFEYYENQGNYCPTSRDCTGSRYPESYYRTYLGVREARVYIRKGPGGSIIGMGSTNTSGHFTISWTSQSPVTDASIYVTTAHKDGVFSLRRNADNTLFQIAGPQRIKLIPGTTATHPQEVGTWLVGSPTTPNVHFNIYAGAHRTWWYALRSSNRMVNVFTGIRVLLFTDSSGDECPNSCSFPDHVKIDDAAPFRPQARIMHELGHVAALQANPHKKLWDFGYAGNGGWSYNSSEWLADSFEEGFATFVADAALYRGDNPQPHSCLSSNACSLATYDVEASTQSCGPGQARWPVTMMRLLRDYHDSSNESPSGSAYDDVSTPFHGMIDVYASYEPGTGNHQINEPFDSWLQPDDKDGRSASDWEFAYDEYYGTDTSHVRALNCNVQ